MNADIGRIIEEQVRKQGRSVSWLARQLSCHRTNIYDIFRRNNIDIVLLHRLSVLLDYDFSRNYLMRLEMKEKIPRKKVFIGNTNSHSLLSVF